MGKKAVLDWDLILIWIADTTMFGTLQTKAALAWIDVNIHTGRFNA